MPILGTLAARVPVLVWTELCGAESEALDQLKRTASLPWVYHHVAAMPDMHLGKGAVIGSVVAMDGAVSPACVGVDIGCGMMAAKTTLKAHQLPDNLQSLRFAIESAVPVGFTSHQEPLGSHLSLWQRFNRLTPEVHGLEGRARLQTGTLGGGNHFIEICLDQEQSVWVLLHSGSRNIGKELAEIHIARAKRLAHNQDIPDRELAVFLAGTPQMEQYRHDLYWAQEYALKNREIMADIILEAIKLELGLSFTVAEEPVRCHHNYVAEEQHFGKLVFVTRKGAINAELGRLGIIPGSMGQHSYIVRGLGNPESFSSASHGAGRKMSRGKAKKHFTVEELERQTEGVECRKDKGVLDEIPGAYKSLDQVMANQADLVEVVHKLKAILCVKG